ncbi:MAG: DUF4384 domain-containing protein [Bacteroidales bacterium]|nr:DUF4384 domain-containing protein [Bacteroidales bacterium]
MNKILCFITLAAFATTVVAQEQMRVCGKYTYRANEYESEVAAKQMALNYAKIEAIKEVFGTQVSSEANLHKIDDNGNISVSFHNYVGTMLRGEWVADDGKPIFHEPKYEQGMRLYTVEVCGWAREMDKSGGIDINAKVLKNGTEEKHEDRDFEHGDDIYLLFSAPVDGYLAVYLRDDVYAKNQTVYCLLPYMKGGGDAVRIEGGKEYIFFSKKHADRSQVTVVEEYHLTTEKPVEYNELYIIFSRDKFTIAGDKQDRHSDNLPRHLSYKNFSEWVRKNSTAEVRTKQLIIRKTE